MTSIRIFSIPLLLCFLTSCSNTRTVTALKTEAPITIDGSISDWNRTESEVESLESVSYYSAHDDDNLYLFIDIKSPVKNNQIKQSGYIVYLNHSKDTRKRVGIGFPAGSFNLLRQDPGTYHSFTDDPDWSENAANMEFLSELAEENFERVMIVERVDGSSSAEYGFVDPSQLEVDGMEIAYNDGRLISIEMKIPLDGSSVFGITSNDVWLGFAVEPPDFNLNQNDYNVSNNRSTGRYGSQNRQPSSTQMRQYMNRNLGQYERWYRLQIQ